MAPKVLIVDDDKVVRSLLDRRLHESGCDSVFAADAISAIGVARRENPDLILLDVGLPAGDAFVVLERLQTLPQLAHVPVIVISATGGEDRRRRALEAGALAFFEKSADTDELIGAVLAELAR